MSEPSDATLAFERLAENHARESRTHRRRFVCIALIAFAFFAVALTAGIREASTSPARRYANAFLSEVSARDSCDESLGKRRFGVGSQIVANVMCAEHSNNSILAPDPKALTRFLVIGDWGRDGMCCQRDVAAEMNNLARHWSPEFVANVGDNFYNFGVESYNDPQVESSWTDVYRTPFEALGKLPWMSVPGNHDHTGNVLAQVELGRKNKKWYMPALHFFHELANGKIFLAFLDTTPMYYPDTELRAFFRGNVTDPKAASEQIVELERQLKSTKAKWKIVIGHHPMFSSGDHVLTEGPHRQKLKNYLFKVLRDNKVAAYFSGHEHTLEHSISDNIHFFVSGAGSKISLVFRHIPENVFAIGRQGFMAVAVHEDSLAVNVIDMFGMIMHSALVKLP